LSALLLRRFAEIFVSVLGLSKTFEIEPWQTNSIVVDPALMAVACFFWLGAAKDHAQKKLKRMGVRAGKNHLFLHTLSIGGGWEKPLLFGLRTSINYRLEFSAKPYVFLSQPVAKMERILPTLHVGVLADLVKKPEGVLPAALMGSGERSKYEVFMATEKKPTILCIDDYENSLIGRQMLLEGEGYDVVSATDWRNGLQLFASCAIDEVVLDYGMPGMTGDVIASHMKQLKPTVPILMVSGDGPLPRDKLKPVEAFLPKMEPIASFLATVKLLLNTSERAKATYQRLDPP
jgi:CheY-like chemotaxis protein